MTCREYEIEITAVGDDVRKFLNINTNVIREEPFDMVSADSTRERPCRMCGAMPNEPHRGCILR